MSEVRRSGSQTLERGLLVLQAVMAAPEGLTVTEVAATTGLHRTIVHRLLASLVGTGFASRDAAGRHHAGPALVPVGGTVRVRLREAAEPLLHRVALEVDATASLVEVVGDAAVATVVAEPPTDGPRFSYRLGNRDPLDRGAGGIAALASAPASPEDDERVREARAAGVVTTHGELNPGAYGVAVPVPGVPGVPACVSVVTNREEVARLAAPALLAAAAELVALLGRTAPPVQP